MSAPCRSEIVAEARAWLGTPYHHQASRQHAGCDCLGLVRGVWRRFYGEEPENPPPYTPDWADALAQETLLEAARRHLVEIPVGDMRAGDIVLFRMGMGAPARHAAIVSDRGRIIHAYWGRCVVETRLGDWWMRRMAAAFSFPGVKEG